MHEHTAVVGIPPAELRVRIISRVMDFVSENLAGWRDEPPGITDEGEEKLTHKLHDYLSDKAHGAELFFFHLEEPQEARRRVDLSAKPIQELRAQLFETNRYCPITVLEAKRIPAPSEDRLKEYLTGGPDMTGGVQRFKACAHGAAHETAALIGYIQKRDSAHHFAIINKWIADFAESSPDGLPWGASESLRGFVYNPVEKTARSISVHPREPNHPILLHHLWIEMLC